MRYASGATWFVLALLAGVQSGAADEAPWRSTAADGELAFSAWWEGTELPGHFADFTARAQLDETGTHPIALTVEVRVGSADMNDREINAELVEPDWFNAASFPLAVFASTEIHRGESGYLAAGSLRLKGVEHPLEIPLDWQRDGDSVTLSGTVTLSRQDWQVGAGEWASNASLSDRVELRYRVVLTPER
jgi:polyisoprenoid-binding protein YceI